jgi:double-stranded uracil-DNA glycosylase
LGPADFKRLPDFGIGLTDLAKTSFGIDSSLAPTDFDRKQLLEKLSAWRPRILAFNGKMAASILFAKPTRSLDYGRQPNVAEGPILWILPSTSGAANRYWSDFEWDALARFIDSD